MGKPKYVTVDGLKGLEVDGEILICTQNHPIRVMINDEVYELPQSGIVTRINMTGEDRDHHAGMPIERPVYGEINGLPEEKPGVVYVVSSPVINALNDSRQDVVAKGRTIGHGDKQIVVSFRRKF